MLNKYFLDAINNFDRRSFEENLYALLFKTLGMTPTPLLKCCGINVSEHELLYMQKKVEMCV